MLQVYNDIEYCIQTHLNNNEFAMAQTYKQLPFVLIKYF